MVEPEDTPTMKHAFFIPAAALLLLAACTESSSNMVGVSDPLAAGKAHFIKNATSCTEVGLTLVCTFKEAGLESGSVETVTVSVLATRVDVCLNCGGQVPNDPKKTTTTAIATASGTFSADKNGNIVGTLTVQLPATSLSCPPGQVATLESSNFVANAGIADATSGASISVGGF
jgi:hypothetical protein